MPMLRTIDRPMNATLRPCAVRGVEHLLHAVHVRGEAGDDDRAARLAEHVVEHRADLALGVTKPGTSAFVESLMQQVDALAPEPRPAAEVGDAARRAGAGPS